MKIKYIAYDGTEFESKEECEKYIKEYYNEISKIIFLDSNFDKESDVYEAYYIFVPSQKMVDYLNDCYGIEDLSVGWNIYNSYEDMFVSASSIYYELEKTIKELKSAGNFFK